MARNSQDNLSSWVGKYSDQYLFCRTMGHSWQIKAVRKLMEAGRRYVRVYAECVSCEMGKTDWYTPFGEKASNTVYHKPEGYYVPRGVLKRGETLDRNMVRREMFGRFAK